MALRPRSPQYFTELRPCLARRAGFWQRRPMCCGLRSPSGPGAGREPRDPTLRSAPTRPSGHFFRHTHAAWALTPSLRATSLLDSRPRTAALLPCDGLPAPPPSSVGLSVAWPCTHAPDRPTPCRHSQDGNVISPGRICASSGAPWPHEHCCRCPRYLVVPRPRDQVDDPLDRTRPRRRRGLRRLDPVVARRHLV